ncbi:hypothetical protein BCR33DRAFT_6760 [Rhizoclosmatium globosum]|uniref:Uncharacterized protein n=1 Tax=Rhizoclosmatium globosum TaxID=329046 RepID=A0A1Y2D375_9FUNG|nr:hypothetical protein BCR33DRAFT_6760 [Rhizoclosmatium globosum]|eukprot:ORY53710.1 hypothetical protein BCR33DRAFT_6760 [Rhizoclosmatium globosum]
MFCHLLTRTCRTSTAYATQSIRIVKRSLATAVSQRPPSLTDEVSTVATAPTRSLARRTASPPNQPQKVSHSPTIVAVHQTLRRAVRLVDVEHLLAAMVAAKPTFARWSLALRFLHLCPNLLLPNATRDRLQLMDRLLEYPANNNEQFKLASSVWREFNACLDEAIRVEISKPNPCILKLRLDAMSKGTHGSVILHLSSDSFARPPLSLSMANCLF